jgi:hypothetical protein
MATPNFTKGIGRLATDRYDFQLHLEGQNPSGFTDFRHTADQVDILNPFLVFGVPTTVEQALENITGFITAETNAGIGFACVPDGYDTYHNQNGTINFDPTVPSLDTFLIPLFTAIINGNPVPPQFARLQHGGILLIKSGTYTIANTVPVPPGITIMGEGYGTKIVNITSLNISPTPGVPPTPKISPTPAPLFDVIADPNRSNNDAAVDPNLFMFSRETRFMNLVIADNFVEPTVLGDTFYKLPQNNSANLSAAFPLIKQEAGSNLTCENVFFVGRVVFSSGQIVNSASASAIQTFSTIVPTGGSLLKINNCFIDGFSVPLEFFGQRGSLDFVHLTNSKIRAYGYFNGDNTHANNNSFIVCSDCNMIIANNHLYGNAANILAVVDFNTLSLGGVPALQAKSKITATANNVIINRIGSPSNNNTNNVFQFYNNDTAGGAIYNYITISGRPTVITAAMTPYTVDSITPIEPYSNILLVDTSSSSITINLPTHLEGGQSITIKDFKGNAATNNIVVVPPVGIAIEGVVGNKIFATNFGSWTLLAFNDASGNSGWYLT